VKNQYTNQHADRHTDYGVHFNSVRGVIILRLPSTWTHPKNGFLLTK